MIEQPLGHRTDTRSLQWSNNLRFLKWNMVSMQALNSAQRSPTLQWLDVEEGGVSKHSWEDRP